MSVSPTHPSSRAGMIWRGALVGVATLAMVLGLIPAAAHAAEPAASVPAEPLTASSSVGLSIPEVAALAVDAAAAVETAVKPASLAGFNPANLIDDAVFYDGNAMTAAQIQTFLDQRIGNCSNGRCLNVSQASISSRAALVSQATGNVVCNAIAGGTMRVSELIYRVQRACGISAKVILVTLEKEQGLTTSRAPSDWNLRAAMGAYCPDSAPCDPAFAGVGPQIVAGVTQLKMYRAGAFARQPGTHFIQYHPNQSCGGTNVNVQNYATAALYNYTPYQPNPASLAAVSGTGDGCSSYGNRNFYRFFTSWFGSVRAIGGSPLVKAGNDVYLVTGTSRYHVFPSVVSEYQRAWGTPRTVSRSFVDEYRDAGPATRYLRNESNGEVSFLEGGTRHWLGGCGMVAAWGSACGSETSLASAEYTGLRRGADMTFFGRDSANGQLYYISGTNRHTVYNNDAAKAINGGQSPFAPNLPAAALSRLTESYFYHYPGRFIELGGRIYLPTTSGSLYYLPSWAQAAELGLPSEPYRVVGSAHVRGYAAETTLRSSVVCNGRNYFAASGTLHPVTADAVAGLPSVSLDARACAELRIADTTAQSRLFVRANGTSAVYLSVNGVFRHVTSPSLVQRLAGTSNPTVLQVSQAFLNTLSRGSQLTSDFDLIQPGQFADVGTPVRVFLPTQDRRVLYLPSWSVAEEIGLPLQSSLRTGEGALSTHRQDGALSVWVSCGGVAHFASRGMLHPVTREASAGFTVSVLDDPICRTLTRSTAAPMTGVFIQSVGQDPVYYATGGVFRHVTSPTLLRQLNGGVAPVLLGVSEATLARLPKGAAMTP